METAIGEFLDHFYALPPDARPQTLAAEPAIADDRRINALVGAIAEHLARNHTLPPPPAWVDGPGRFLAMPWFTTPNADAALCEYLTCFSPAAFKRRNIMTDNAPLRRARAPIASPFCSDASTS